MQMIGHQTVMINPDFVFYQIFQNDRQKSYIVFFATKDVLLIITSAQNVVVAVIR
jgi:hypothetical protein